MWRCDPFPSYKRTKTPEGQDSVGSFRRRKRGKLTEKKIRRKALERRERERWVLKEVMNEMMNWCVRE